MFWSAGCSLLRAEGFSCSLDVLFRGLELSRFNFLIKNIFIFSALKLCQTPKTTGSTTLNYVLVQCPSTVIRSFKSYFSYHGHFGPMVSSKISKDKSMRWLKSVKWKYLRLKIKFCSKMVKWWGGVPIVNQIYWEKFQWWQQQREGETGRMRYKDR